MSVITAAAIPRIEGDMDVLAGHAQAISAFGTAFADTGQRVNATWQGLASVYQAPEAGQLLAAMAPVQAVCSSVGEDHQIVGRVLGTYVAEVREIQARLDALRVQAAAFESVVGDDAWGGDPVTVERNDELQRAVAAAMADFDEAQRRCANAINTLYGGQQYRASDGDGRHEPGEYAHGAPAVPKPGTSPQQVHAWWNSLTPAQRQSLIETYPARIGALDGIPVEARDGANRIVLGMVTAGLLARRQELKSGAPGDRLKRMAQVRVIDAQLAGIRAIERRLGPPQPGQQQAYLLGLNADDFGQAIVAIGNPDTADNVVTFVPGTYSSLGGAAGGLEKVENMVDAANRVDPGARTAGVMWIGYDAPQSLGEAGDVSYAHRGGGDLDRFQDGLRATHVGPPSHNTVVAHSYGSTVAGVTARDHGLAVDNTVFVGSPGVGTDHARELGLPADSVWATRADNDVIQHAYDHTDLRTPVHPLVPTNVPNPDPDLAHGNDPTDADFGGHVFGSDPGTSMWSDPQAAHSEYWDKRTKSLRNFGYIIVDRPDLVKP